MKQSSTRHILVVLLTAVFMYGCSIIPIDNWSSNKVILSGANEVPSVVGDGYGIAEISFDRQSYILKWTIKYSELSGPATAAHFHSPASLGQNADVVIPISGSLDSPIRGFAKLSGHQIDQLIVGNWYLNIHTALNPQGEIRGQIKTFP